MKNETGGLTKTCGLIGFPVRHTLSPLIHNMLSDLTGQDQVYVPFEVEKGNLEAAVKGALALGIRGLNVTVPYKQAVIPFLAKVDPLAEAIGAVNTLVRTEDGKGFKGYNTDMSGLSRAMKEDGIQIQGEKVIVLGAGGAARAVLFLLAKEGASQVYLLNRTPEKADALAREVESTAGRAFITALSLQDFTKIPSDKGQKYLCIQCTSVGLSPNVQDAPIDDPSFYRLLHTAVDLIYRPFQTMFLQKAKAQGAAVHNGLKMLLYQAVDAFELWTGLTITEGTKAIYDRLCMEQNLDGNIVLIGFMGCGKTTVSEILAQKLGFTSKDTDDLIARQEGLSVRDIFAEKGEEAFRDLETSCMQQLCKGKTIRTVLAVGGGLPLREENRQLLGQFGQVVYLKTEPETVYDRVREDTSRPLLKGEDLLDRIRTLSSQREIYYQMAAGEVVTTDGKRPEEIADEIIARLHLAG